MVTLSLSVNKKKNDSLILEMDFKSRLRNIEMLWIVLASSLTVELAVCFFFASLIVCTSGPVCSLPAPWSDFLHKSASPSALDKSGTVLKPAHLASSYRSTAFRVVFLT